MKLLITGDIGFIGFHLAKRALSEGHTVLGIDNHNAYYDVSLKEARLKELESLDNYTHLKLDLNEIESLEDVQYDAIINLAAQAGVRHSLKHPHDYVDSNVSGFLHVLEYARRVKPAHLIYASSSSVYGLNQTSPFSVNDEINHPASLYAATKRANELMAHAYSHLYQVPTTGLRFFTVYGPFGRPDMASYIFAKNIFEGNPIEVFNNGDMIRDFTYIDDIVDGIMRLIPIPPKEKGLGVTPNASKAPYAVYNLGNNEPVKLLDYIHELERLIGKKAKMIKKPMQMGDVYKTYADIDASIKDFGYNPKTSYKAGLKAFIDWFKAYHTL